MRRNRAWTLVVSDFEIIPNAFSFSDLHTYVYKDGVSRISRTGPAGEQPSTIAST